MRRLAVFMNDDRAGTLSCEVRASTFQYDDEYLRGPEATPLSLSMPLRRGEHPSGTVQPFLWGLLPDNAETLRRWALLARPHADENNAFSLLEHYGRDCAGAVRFFPMSDLEQAQREEPTEWLTEHDIGEHLEDLRQDPDSWSFEDDDGRFSLAGTQAKFALLREDGRWGRPRGSTPTTHIFKPGMLQFRSSALNEHLCLRIASLAGLPAARSRIESFEGHVAIVVERYDRRRTSDGLTRLHQEDFCQALSVPPAQKYQEDGGPSLLRMAELIRDAQRSDEARATITRLLLATAFNWLIAAPDSHAKNYSILLHDRHTALAPLYDIASLAPYKRYRPDRAKIAQSVGGHYRIADIGREQWSAEAQRLGLADEMFLESLRGRSERVLTSIDAACAEPASLAADAEFVAQFRERVTGRVRQGIAAL
ncbi:type II toxin-antitoxin system HipA family toxin [Leifsonia sp. McL0607]|uniref:type II toxin-antitoxin system HipA family toxin n=1 Tax=Leifsonia sp. McL0607 TaxID=3415672 RepID=UPI003CF285D7